MLVTILNYALIAIFFAGMIIAAWANFQMLLRARASGGRFWAFTPFAMFAGMTIQHTLIFFASWVVCAAAVFGLNVLNHGLAELKAALSGVHTGSVKR